MSAPARNRPQIRAIPDGEARARLTSLDCGFIACENPNAVVGSVAGHDGRVLPGRHPINPRAGFWTLPAGSPDMAETAEPGTLPEAIEEARARLVLEGMLGVSSIPPIGQVKVIFRARPLDPAAIAPTTELGEVALPAWHAVPWPEPAFASAHGALDHWRASLDGLSWPARGAAGSA